MMSKLLIIWIVGMKFKILELGFSKKQRKVNLNVSGDLFFIFVSKVVSYCYSRDDLSEFQ